MELERRQGPGEVLDRHVAQAGLLVAQREVAMRERPPLGVLAGEPDVGSLGEQRGECEGLGVAVLDRPGLEDLGPSLERLAQLAVDREALRHAQQLLVERPQPLLGDRRLDLGTLSAVELRGAELGRGRVLVFPGVDLRFQLLVDRL